MKKILHWLDENLEMTFCVFLMTSMTILIFLEVIMRLIFNNSLTWSEELARYIFIWLIFLSISYGCKVRKHIKFDAGLLLFPKKLRPFVVLLGDLLFLAFALYVAYTGFGYSMDQISFKFYSPTLKIPFQYIYLSTFVGFGLASFRQIQTIIYRINCIRKGDGIHG
ncbi:MAG: TRAP transporter small permease [Eubacteriales bacterium]